MMMMMMMMIIMIIIIIIIIKCFRNFGDSFKIQPIYSLDKCPEAAGVTVLVCQQQHTAVHQP